MNKSNLSFSSIAMACALCVAAVPALAQGQSASKPGDPARWYAGNKSQQQSLATIKKEINAAYAQQKSECQRGAKAERASCLQQASQTYRSDMANARELVANAPSGGVSERVVATTAADGNTTAMGASQAGASAAGSADGANPAADAKQGMDAGAAATGNSGAGSTGSGSNETGAGARDAAAAGGTDAASGQMPPVAPQPPAAATTPPRSEDTPIQR
jgi:hypothetical protein